MTSDRRAAERLGAGLPCQRGYCAWLGRKGLLLDRGKPIAWPGRAGGMPRKEWFLLVLGYASRCLATGTGWR
eukprot:3868956-Lingulodinium_polyedra.AAC.1